MSPPCADQPPISEANSLADVGYWHISGHANRADECPFLGVKRTSLNPSPMSANDPKRTLAGAQLFRSSATAIAGAAKSAFDLGSRSFLDPRLGLFSQARCHGLRVLRHVDPFPGTSPPPSPPPDRDASRPTHGRPRSDGLRLVPVPSTPPHSYEFLDMGEGLSREFLDEVAVDHRFCLS